MEAFNLILKRRIIEDNRFKYHWKCDKLQLTHMCFADDLLIFCAGNQNSIRVIKEALAEFSSVDGLNPNLSKSNIFFGNVKLHTKNSILSILPFVEGKSPMRYLGAPLIATRLFKKDCKVLIEKF